MSFVRPEFLWLALLALPELLLGLRRIPAFRVSLEALAGPRRRPLAGTTFAALSLASTVAAALFVVSAALALAGPAWGSRGVAVERRGLEAAVVLDVSRSMEASDMGGRGGVSQTRLEAAKRLIDFVVRGPAGAGPSGGGSGSADGSGISFSLVAAKGASVLLVPMTEDLFAFEDSLDYANPDTITSPGTDLESGIRAGLASFAGVGAQGKMLLLFTDGGELSGSARRACAEAQAADCRLVIIGMGSSAPSPVPGPDGRPLVGARGPVRSALDASSLKALAALAGGRYISGSDPRAGAMLAAELKSGIGTGTRIEHERQERSGLFALLALAFLAAAMLASLFAPRGTRA